MVYDPASCPSIEASQVSRTGCGQRWRLQNLLLIRCYILKGRSSGLKWKFLRLQYMSRDAVAVVLENKEAMADEKIVGANTFGRSDDSIETYEGGEKRAYQA